MPEIKYKKCKICKFWNEGKGFGAFEIKQQDKHGLGYDKYRCTKIDEFVADPGHETEGVETRYDFGCIVWEKRGLARANHDRF